MVLDTSNAGGVFGGNAQGPALLLRSDDAPKMHDAAVHRNVAAIDPVGARRGDEHDHQKSSLRDWIEQLEPAIEITRKALQPAEPR